MKKYLKISIIGCLSLMLFLTNCTTPKPLENKNITSMPESFSNIKDSTNASITNWRNYFIDSNLVGLIDTSLKNNLDISIALQKIEMARSNVRAKKGALFPTVNGFTSAGQRRFGLYTMDGAGNITTEITPGQIVPIHLPDYAIGIQASWEADLWGKLKNKKKAEIARYLSTIEGKNLVVTNLIADIANAYYELIALDNELDIIRETILLREKAFNLVTLQKESAVANELIVRQFEAQLWDSRSLEYEVLQKIVRVENQINFLLNRYPQEVKRNKATFSNPFPFQNNVGIPADLLTNRPDIKQAEYELVAAKADLKAAKAAFYPSITITGAYGFQAFKTSFLFTTPQSTAYTLLGTLTAPLVNRSAIKAAFHNANAQQQEAMYSYQQKILNGYTEVYNELAAIKNLDTIYQFKTNKVVALSKAIDASSELFKTGRANYIEVLLAQNGTLESKIAQINTRQLQYNAYVNIYKALGGGWQ